MSACGFIRELSCWIAVVGWCLKIIKKKRREEKEEEKRQDGQDCTVSPNRSTSAQVSLRGRKAQGKLVSASLLMSFSGENGRWS
jgi:hypothetical protein